MPYGIIKVDTVTFTDNGIDKNISLSGLVQNPTFTGNVTATGTISGDVIRGGTTISGVTVTGTTANFVSGVFTTQVSGVTVIATTGTFTSLTGTTATFTSGIIASGTAALPSLAVLSDPNTGLFSPGADQLAISTNGTGRLFVTASGNVGVRTSTPGNPLAISQTVSTTFGNAGTYLGLGGTENTAGQKVLIGLGYKATASDEYPSVIGYEATSNAGNQNGAIVFGTRSVTTNTAPTERLRITADGLVGLGTSSPAARLEVLVASQAPSGGSARTGSIFFNQGGDAELAIGCDVSLINRPTWLQGRHPSAAFDSTRYDILLQPLGGNVGIGTTSPSAPLHINGTANNTAITLSVAGTVTGYIGPAGFLGGSDNNMGFRVDSGGNQVFYIGAAEKMRLDSSGRLLVGTTSSTGKITVQGNESDPVVRLSGITAGVANYSLDIKQSTGAQIDFVQRWFTSSQQESTVLSFGSGNLFSLITYSVVVGGTNRDLYIDNAGLIGYVSSTRNSKGNVAEITDTAWIYQLNPVSFNRKKLNEDKQYTDELYLELEYGLIAEEVEQIAPELCFYDDIEGKQELRGVHYNKLIAPMLKALQQANARIETLEAKVAAFEAV